MDTSFKLTPPGITTALRIDVMDDRVPSDGAVIDRKGSASLTATDAKTKIKFRATVDDGLAQETSDLCGIQVTSSMLIEMILDSLKQIPNSAEISAKYVNESAEVKTFVKRQKTKASQAAGRSKPREQDKLLLVFSMKPIHPFPKYEFPIYFTRIEVDQLTILEERLTDAQDGLAGLSKTHQHEMQQMKKRMEEMQALLETAQQPPCCTLHAIGSDKVASTSHQQCTLATLVLPDGESDWLWSMSAVTTLYYDPYDGESCTQQVTIIPVIGSKEWYPASACTYGAVYRSPPGPVPLMYSGVVKIKPKMAEAARTLELRLHACSYSGLQNILISAQRMNQP